MANPGNQGGAFTHPGPQTGSTKEQWPSSLAHATEGSVMQKARDTASDLAERARDAAGQAAQRAGDAASSAAQRVSEVASDVRHRAENLTEDFTGMIRRYPVQSFLVGVGFGFLVGELLCSDR